MNKEVRKVKLISKNILESILYYSKFNPLYIQEQERKDIALDKLSVKEYEDPFRDSGK